MSVLIFTTNLPITIVCLTVVGLALAGIIRLRDRRRRRKLREALAEWETCERELMRLQEFEQSMRDVEMYREFEAPEHVLHGDA